jgi:transcriptional adapter 2-alpha
MSTVVAARFHCDYCQRDISNVTRIKCSICSDFDLCLDCFSVGVELNEHKSNHDYQVVDQMNFPLFDERWGADEELLLLEAIGLYGMGNWADIADHVATKSSDECERHYFEAYMTSTTAPLPDMSRQFESRVVDPRHRKPHGRPRGKDTPQLSGGPKMVPDSGYMLLRHEFDADYLNDAEDTIATMMPADEHDSLSMQRIKLAMLRVFRRRLEERYRVREFVVESGLLDVKKIQARDRKRPRDERDLASKLRVFLQVLRADEYERFSEGLINELRMRKRIKELQMLRRAGITTFYEAEEFIGMRGQSIDPDLFAPACVIGEPEPLDQFPSSSSSSSLASSSNLGSSSSSRRPKRGCAPLDISRAPDVHLLSAREHDLCANLRLYPQQYMLIKSTLIRENTRLGHLKKRQARQLLQIDANKTSKVFDFLEAAGWLNSIKRHRNVIREASIVT